MGALADTIRRHTVVASPPLCPEIRLCLVTETCPLWRATQADLARLGLSDPYWAFAWPGGQALARHLLDNRQLIRGRSVLDFGAGCGVEAVAAALSGARSVIATDVDALAAEACRLNAEINGVAVAVVTEDVLGRDDGWDIVLAGDVLYERDLAEKALPWFAALARRGAVVLIGDPGRGFWSSDGARAVATYDAPADVDPDGRLRRRTTVYLLSST